MNSPQNWLKPDLHPAAPRRYVRRIQGLRQREPLRSRGATQSHAGHSAIPCFCQPAAAVQRVASPCPTGVVHLNEAIVSSERLFQSLLGRGIDVATRLAGGLPPVIANARQIMQILLNVAASARAAMPHGGQLTMTTELGPPQKDGGKLAAGRMTNDSWHPSGVAGNRWMPSLSLPAACPPPSNVKRHSDFYELPPQSRAFTEPLGQRISRPIFSAQPECSQPRLAPDHAHGARPRTRRQHRDRKPPGPELCGTIPARQRRSCCISCNRHFALRIRKTGRQHPGRGGYRPHSLHYLQHFNNARLHRVVVWERHRSPGQGTSFDDSNQPAHHRHGDAGNDRPTAGSGNAGKAPGPPRALPIRL